MYTRREAALCLWLRPQDCGDGERRFCVMPRLDTAGLSCLRRAPRPNAEAPPLQVAPLAELSFLFIRPFPSRVDRLFRDLSRRTCREKSDSCTSLPRKSKAAVSSEKPPGALLDSGETHGLVLVLSARRAATVLSERDSWLGFQRSTLHGTSCCAGKRGNRGDSVVPGHCRSPLSTKKSTRSPRQGRAKCTSEPSPLSELHLEGGHAGSKQVIAPSVRSSSQLSSSLELTLTAQGGPRDKNDDEGSSAMMYCFNSACTTVQGTRETP